MQCFLWYSTSRCYAANVVLRDSFWQIFDISLTSSSCFILIMFYVGFLVYSYWGANDTKFDTSLGAFWFLLLTMKQQDMCITDHFDFILLADSWGWLVLALNVQYTATKDNLKYRVFVCCKAAQLRYFKRNVLCHNEVTFLIFYEILIYFIPTISFTFANYSGFLSKCSKAVCN